MYHYSLQLDVHRELKPPPRPLQCRGDARWRPLASQRVSYYVLIRINTYRINGEVKASKKSDRRSTPDSDQHQNLTTYRESPVPHAYIGMDLKKQLVRSLIWSTALYGSESWALKKCDEKLVTAFEMWVWRRLLRTSWTERKTNTWLREKIGIGLPEEKGILEQIRHRKLSKYCHRKRRSDSVVLATIKGEIEGKCFLGEEEQRG